MASPSPKLASMDNTFLLEVTGSAVNKFLLPAGRPSSEQPQTGGLYDNQSRFEGGKLLPSR